MIAHTYRRLGRSAILAATVAVLSFGSAAAVEEEIPWAVSCEDEADAETCRMYQRLDAQKEIDGELKNIGKILGLTVIYIGGEEAERKPLLVMDLPLGVDLRPGMVLRVDEGKETTAPYLQCTMNGCSSNLLLTPAVIKTLREGLKLRIGFRPWGSTETMIIDAGLKGFTKAFARLR